MQYFGMPSIYGSEAQLTGFNVDLEGRAVGRRKLNPVLRVHVGILEQAGYTKDRLICNFWPVPKLQRLPIALPYCDNLTIVGRGKAATEEEHDRL
eukprot:12884222-Alexandrium_andersonii.AAC.1